jgi:hypothetical protein
MTGFPKEEGLVAAIATSPYRPERTGFEKDVSSTTGQETVYTPKPNTRPALSLITLDHL